MAENSEHKKKPWWRNWRRNVTLLGVVMIIALVRWITLPEPRHFWPRYADDWSAWGTCVGAVGTILAVIYAAETLKSTSAAQIIEQRDRRLEMDHLDTKDAEEANKLRPDTKGFPRASDEYGDSPDITGARILVQNFSDHPFHDVQILVPEESLEEGVTLSEIEYWETSQVHHETRGWGPDSWKKIEAPGAPVPGQNLFMLGTVLARQCRSVSFDFSEEVMGMDWSHRSRDAVESFGRDIMISVTFVDHNDKTWQRTSRDGGKIRRIRFPDLKDSQERQTTTT